MSRTKEVICRVKALYAYESNDPSSLSFKPDAIIDVLAQLESGWWDGWYFIYIYKYTYQKP